LILNLFENPGNVVTYFSCFLLFIPQNQVITNPYILPIEQRLTFINLQFNSDSGESSQGRQFLNFTDPIMAKPALCPCTCEDCRKSLTYRDKNGKTHSGHLWPQLLYLKHQQENSNPSPLQPISTALLPEANASCHSRIPAMQSNRTQANPSCPTNYVNTEDLKRLDLSNPNPNGSFVELRPGDSNPSDLPSQFPLLLTPSDFPPEENTSHHSCVPAMQSNQTQANPSCPTNYINSQDLYETTSQIEKGTSPNKELLCTSELHQTAAFPLQNPVNLGNIGPAPYDNSHLHHNQFMSLSIPS
ncbi:hypothetical protein MJO28_006590, partial [Puccinia striiformis f. sp. tritici]